MPDEELPTPKKRVVVKKTVVKKTVIRPVPGQKQPGHITPKVRPVAKAPPKAPAGVRETSPTTGTAVKSRTGPSKAPKTKVPAKPRRERLAPLAKSIGAAANSARGASARTGRGVGVALAATGRGIRSARLPDLRPVPASALVGAVVGVVVVALAALSMIAFSAFRGTSSGGGALGSIALLLIGAIAFALGRYLLEAFHVRQPAVTSFLAVMITLLAVLAFFLELSSTALAWLVLPALTAAASVVAHLLLVVADGDTP